jgi:hypothetical protein
MKPALAATVSVLAGAVMLSGSALATGSARSGIAITAGGRIGSLQLDRSTRTAVVAAMGRPTAVRTSRFVGAHVSYTALGYGCHGGERQGTLALTLQGPYCTTVFLINGRTRKLADFFSGSRRYIGPGGIRVGTPSAVAERVLHQRLRRACGENLGLSSRIARMTIEFAGGTERSDRHVVGAHLQDFVLTSRRHDVGLYRNLC